MPKINQEEYEILKGLDNRWKWIARDDENQIYSAELYVFDRKPEQEDGYWNNISNGEYALLEERDDPFQFIQWEDEEPYEIAELIREYEIKELRLAPSGTVIVDSFDESEETEVKDIEELKSWFDDDKSYTGEYVKFKINHCRWGDGAEEEQKYNVELKVRSSSGAIGIFLYKKGDEVLAGNNLKAYYPEKDEFRLTEQEIKNYDERFWAFAEPVEEDNND